MNLDFDLLWQKIQKGDESSFEKVYNAAFKPLVSYAYEITGQNQLAEEVVQDVFLKIWKNHSVIFIKGSFKAYLFQAIHNDALNVIRQQKTKKGAVNMPSSEEIWQFISDNYTVDDNLVESIFSDETEVIIGQAIDELPEQCQRIFRMSRFESLENREISIRLGISENTVKAHIYRALQKIAIALEKEK